MASDNVVTFKDESFEAQVLKSDVPVLVDFWATWCAPCRAIAPHVEAVAEQFKGQVKVGKLDIDSDPGAPSRFGVRAVPTLILFKDGRPVDQIIGGVPRSRLEEMVKKHLS
jgi:thioredoxin 1